MSWEALAAIGTLLSAAIVAVASVAAIVQIRHLSTANQLAAVLQIYDRINNREMTEARQWCLHELPRLTADSASLARAAASLPDPRITMVGNFFNELGFLVVDGFLDRRFVLSLVPLSARMWSVFAPLAAEMRRGRTDPVWADFEYLACLQDDLTRERLYARFPPAFRARLERERG